MEDDKRGGSHFQQDAAEKRVKTGSGFLKFCAKHSFNPIVVVIVLVLVLALATSTVVFGVKVMRDISSKTVEFSLKDIGELATQVGYYTSVQTHKNDVDLWGIKIPFTQSKYIYSYDGKIKVGFDFEKIEVNVDKVGKKITVKLPEPKVISNEIKQDSLQIYDESQNIFTPLKLADVNKAQEEMKEKGLETAINNGIFENAVEHAKLLLEKFLEKTYDNQQYKIEFQ